MNTKIDKLIGQSHKENKAQNDINVMMCKITKYWVNLSIMG